MRTKNRELRFGPGRSESKLANGWWTLGPYCGAPQCALALLALELLAQQVGQHVARWLIERLEGVGELLNALLLLKVVADVGDEPNRVLEYAAHLANGVAIRGAGTHLKIVHEPLEFVEPVAVVVLDGEVVLGVGNQESANHVLVRFGQRVALFQTLDRLLTERPDITGISLPGMPQGSPGMTGRKSGPFTIYEFLDDEIEVYATE